MYVCLFQRVPMFGPLVCCLAFSCMCHDFNCFSNVLFMLSKGLDVFPVVFPIVFVSVPILFHCVPMVFQSFINVYLYNSKAFYLCFWCAPVTFPCCFPTALFKSSARVCMFSTSLFMRCVYPSVCVSNAFPKVFLCSPNAFQNVAWTLYVLLMFVCMFQRFLCMFLMCFSRISVCVLWIVNRVHTVFVCFQQVSMCSSFVSISFVFVPP